MDSEANNKERNMSDSKDHSENGSDSQSKSPNIEASESPLPPSPDVISSPVDLDISADKELSGAKTSSPEHQEPRDSSHSSSPSSSTNTIPSSQANTEKYQGDQSSYDSETIVDKSKKKVLKKKKEQQLDSSSDSACAEVTTLAPLRHVSVAELACQTDKTSADMQRVSLPGLVALQDHTQLAVADRAGRLFEGERQIVVEDGGSDRSAVLSTGFSAKLRGDMPAVLVPLDK